jgi:hypothetical protein
MLNAFGTIVFAFPLWLALIAIQALNLAVGTTEHRWLPSGLLAIGLLWCFFVPVYHQWRP